MEDFIPVLGAGPHESPKDGACVMEMVSYLSGDKWTDRPECTNYWIAKTAQAVNDFLTNDDRHLILSQFDRLFNTNKIDPEGLHNYLWEYFSDRITSLIFKASNTSSMFYDVLDHNLDQMLRTKRLTSGNIFEITAVNHEFNGAEDTVKILSDVLDIYDKLTGRTNIEKQDITKLKEIQNV